MVFLGACSPGDTSFPDDDENWEVMATSVAVIGSNFITINSPDGKSVFEIIINDTLVQIYSDMPVVTEYPNVYNIRPEIEQRFREIDELKERVRILENK